MAEKRFERMKLSSRSGCGAGTVESAAPERTVAEAREAEPVPRWARHPLVRLVQPRLEPGGEIPGIDTRLRARPRDTLGRRALAVADLIAATVALLLGVAVIGDDRIAFALIAAIPVVVVVSKVIGLYDRDEQLVSKNTLEEAPALFQVATLFTLAIWLGEGVFLDQPTLAGPTP